MKEYAPNWDFYMSLVDGEISSITTDLNLRKIAPIGNQNHVVNLSIEMPHPRQDGLSSNEDAPMLWAIEDEIEAWLKQIDTDATSVGRLTSNGYRDLYYYVTSTAIDKLKNSVARVMSNYSLLKYKVGDKEDPTWGGYFNFLYPSPRQMRSIQNRRVIDQLLNEGDTLVKKRIVHHWIDFSDKGDMKKFEQQVLQFGYDVVCVSKVKNVSSSKYSIQISRIDSVKYEDIDSYIIQLYDLAGMYNGHYNGWETSVEQ